MEQVELEKRHTVKDEGETETGKCCGFPLASTHPFGLVNGVDLQLLPNLWMCFHLLSQIPEEGNGFLYGIFPTFIKAGEIKLIVDPTGWMMNTA